MSKQTTGEFLSLLRKAAGYTQEDIADKLNVSNKTISSWETDRTMPDVLLLPAIADLYGVTADEILRGERTQPDKASDEVLTEKSKQAIRKNKYGKFNVKCTLLSCISCLCGALIFAATFIESIYHENWISILLYIIGFSGIFVCIAIAAFFVNSIKVSEGIVFKEDLNEDLKPFVWTLNKKISRLIAITSIPFAIATLFYFIVCMMGKLLPGIIENGIPCVFFLLFSLIWYLVGKKKYGSN